MVDRPGTPAEPRVSIPADAEPTPYRGNEYVCPNCRSVIPTRKIALMAKPPRFAHLLNDIIRCCYCNFLFSYRRESVGLRPVTDEHGHPTGTVVSG